MDEVQRVLNSVISRVRLDVIAVVMDVLDRLPSVDGVYFALDSPGPHDTARVWAIMSALT